jgi:type II secretory pathway component PulF
VYVAMVRAGEAGGFLPIVLQQIADFRTREQDLSGKVKAAMVYPPCSRASPSRCSCSC